jgi:hypothetical protein
MSVSSGLSVAVPKYFLPAALAMLKRPALEASVDRVVDTGTVDVGFTLLACVDAEEL